jgi:hypothetical protein
VALSGLHVSDQPVRHSDRPGGRAHPSSGWGSSW